MHSKFAFYKFSFTFYASSFYNAQVFHYFCVSLLWRMKEERNIDIDEEGNCTEFPLSNKVNCKANEEITKAFAVNKELFFCLILEK